MKPGEWELGIGPLDDRPTFLSHALSLSALHGSAPWPAGGHPLPDEPPRPDGDGPLMPSVVMDGIRTHHVSAEKSPPAVADLADLLDRLIAVSPGRNALTELHERLAGESAVGIADDLVAALRERPARKAHRDRLRRIARHLAEYGSRRETVKLGIVLLGVTGDERDRDLLLLLGALEELTLYAVVALLKTQPDRQRAAYALARRVDGWGRIHAVERLKGTGDPEIKDWLLREGFRNGVMNEYLAHLAATTGDLYSALLAPDVDDTLLDGAGAILDALSIGGPAKDMTDYDDAVPAMHRYAELAATARPTLARLDHLLTVAGFIRRPPEEFSWPAGEPERLRGRYAALLDRPVWREIVLAHLAEPVGEFGFSIALACAGRLGVPALPQTLAHLEKDPFDAYAWQWAVRRSDAATITEVTGHAEKLLPLEQLRTGPGTGLCLGPEYAFDQMLEIIVHGLAEHPGAGVPLLRTALENRSIRARRGALQALGAWPRDRRPGRCSEWVAAAAREEPDGRLLAEMDAFLTRNPP